MDKPVTWHELSLAKYGKPFTELSVREFYRLRLVQKLVELRVQATKEYIRNHYFRPYQCPN